MHKQAKIYGINYQIIKLKKVKSLSHVQLFLTPWTVCSLPGSSVHGIFQAGVLEWVAMSFSRGSSQPRDWSRVSHIVGRCFTLWATREVISTFKQIKVLAYLTFPW